MEKNKNMSNFNKCKLCGSEEYKYFFKGMDRFYNIQGTFDVVKCVQCGMTFMNPMPDGDVLGEYYPDNECIYIDRQTEFSERAYGKNKFAYYLRNPIEGFNLDIFKVIKT